MRRISCRDIGVECDFVATGNTDEEVLQKCAQHGKQAHDMGELPPELAQRVKANIKEL
jgi:predicted small metal-binding protein